MAELSPYDRELIDEMRRKGVLQDVVDTRLNQAKGIILVTCSDGDETPELWEFLTKRMQQNGIPPRIHHLALNGGVLLIPPRSQLNASDGEAQVMKRHILESRDIKGITTVSLYAHAPCAAAGKAGINIRGVIALLLEAKEEILRSAEVPLDVACFIHVDHGQDRRRSYYVSRTAWSSMWLSSPSEEVPMTT